MMYGSEGIKPKYGSYIDMISEKINHCQFQDMVYLQWMGRQMIQIKIYWYETHWSDLG